MDTEDILEDKDSGPEVQINFPASVMSRIEELMGDNEQFDSPEFSAVQYMNAMFPTEQSLAGVEAAAAAAAAQRAALARDVTGRLARQRHLRADGQAQLARAQGHIAHLATQVSDMNVRCGESAGVVRAITGEMCGLQRAKRNLTAAITALHHYHMLRNGVQRLTHLADTRQYRELALPLQALTEVLQHFEAYQDIKEISSLREQVQQIRVSLGAQILADFKEAWGGVGAGGRGALSARTLADGAALVDALEPRVKQDLLRWLVDLQLQEYSHLFSPSEEWSWLSHVERRYAWLKKHLLAFEESRANIFPAHWKLSELIALTFCEVTRESLGSQISRRRAELDVKLLLHAVHKTRDFELLLHKRFIGSDAEAEIGDVTTTADGDAGDGAPQPPKSVWVGAIGGVFEPYLSLYVDSLHPLLRQLLDAAIQEAKEARAEKSGATQGDGPTGGHGASASGGGGGGGGAVLASCADLFLLYKRCLVQCAGLSNKQPMLELTGVFKKYLSEYATSVLQGALPRGGGAVGGVIGGAIGGAGGTALTVVTNLHTLLRDDHHTRLTVSEVRVISSVLTTAEYCLETSAHLHQKLKEKIHPSLADQVDLLPEQELFHKVISNCLSMLVADLETGVEPALQAMGRTAWGSVQAVGDQSPYVTQIVRTLNSSVAIYRESLSASRKYFTALCTRFAGAFVPRLTTQLLGMGAVLPPAAAEQLLLDVHTLKTALLALPSAGSSVPRPPPASYARLVLKLITKTELLLKLVMAPVDKGLEPFVAHFVQLLPDCSLNEFHKVLHMKGVKLNKTQAKALDDLFKETAKNANDDSAK